MLKYFYYRCFHLNGCYLRCLRRWQGVTTKDLNSFEQQSKDDATVETAADVNAANIVVVEKPGKLATLPAYSLPLTPSSAPVQQIIAAAALPRPAPPSLLGSLMSCVEDLDMMCGAQDVVPRVAEMTQCGSQQVISESQTLSLSRSESYSRSTFSRSTFTETDTMASSDVKES